jgi:hypothetical protein
MPRPPFGVRPGGRALYGCKEAAHLCRACRTQLLRAECGGSKRVTQSARAANGPANNDDRVLGQDATDSIRDSHGQQVFALDELGNQIITSADLALETRTPANLVLSYRATPTGIDKRAERQRSRGQFRIRRLA